MYVASLTDEKSLGGVTIKTPPKATAVGMYIDTSGINYTNPIQ